MSQHHPNKKVFVDAITLFNSGQTEKAESMCLKAVKKYPRDFNTLGLLGAIQIKLGRSKKAKKYLRQSININPDNPKPNEDLGILLLKLKQPEKALIHLKKATQLNPRSAMAFFHLGKSLELTGNRSEADSAFETAFELSPFLKAMNDAENHLKAGRFDEASAIYRQILELHPKNLQVMQLAAKAAADASRYGEAESLLNQALAIAPDFELALSDLGQLYKCQERYQEAIDCFEKMTALSPNDHNTHFLLADVLALADQTKAAIGAYQRCLSLKPNNAVALLGLGHMLRIAGRHQDAVQAYRACIKLKPGSGETYWSLANLKTFRFGDDEIQQMEIRLNNDEVDQDFSQVNFHFALAKAYEDREEFDQAWSHYQAGNAKQRSLISYESSQTKAYVDSLIDVFDEAFLQTNSDQGDLDSSPIFILGMPRSGSTLIEQILASHTQVEGTAELPYLNNIAQAINRNRAEVPHYPEAVRELRSAHYEAMGEDYLDQARAHRRENRAFFTDKMPNNFFHVGFLHLILPNAKIIDARRNPIDACLGNYKQLFARGQPFSYDLSEVADFYLQYHRLMAHWDKILPGRVLRVRYEDTVSDLEDQVRRILAYCQLPWEDNCLEFHKTHRAVLSASSEQVRRPIYKDAVNFWRHYEGKLDNMIDRLAPLVDRQ